MYEEFVVTRNEELARHGGVMYYIWPWGTQPPAGNIAVLIKHYDVDKGKWSTTPTININVSFSRMMPVEEAARFSRALDLAILVANSGQYPPKFDEDRGTMGLSPR